MNACGVRDGMSGDMLALSWHNIILHAVDASFSTGLGKTSADGKVYNDREVIQRLTSSVDCALHEAEAKLARMRAEQQAEGSQQDR